MDILHMRVNKIEVVDCDACKQMARTTWIPLHIGDGPPKCPKHSKSFKFDPVI